MSSTRSLHACRHWNSTPQSLESSLSSDLACAALGRPIGDMDLLIAATALRHELTLLTNNRRHFNRIPSLALESI